jgi:hypothetical protein
MRNPGLVVLLFAGALGAQYYPPGYIGQNIYWIPAQSPYTPGAGAIRGGPGDDPRTGSPMFICRSRYQGSMQPGKWVSGNCNIAYGGQEISQSSYEIAYGNAIWLPFNRNTFGLIQTGTDTDGTPLYSCRLRYYGGIPGNFGNNDRGYQPGKLLNGMCHIPFGGQELVQPPPFEALYSPGGNYPPQYPVPPTPTTPVTPYAQPGPSSVTWQGAETPFTPGPGAIMGGPGNGPKPGAPLYICRAGTNGGLFPGKWIQGECSIACNGQEWKMKRYDVAYGKAIWEPFSGITSTLVQGGYDTDGSPLYICRVPNFKPTFKRVGNQPGKLVGGVCHVPYANVDITQDPPFEALYSVPDQSAVTGPQGSAPASSPAAGGLEIVFQAGTSASGGKISVKNGNTGVSIDKTLAPNLPVSECASVLQGAAFEAGLQIQAEAGGKGLRVFGSKNSVVVTGASVAVSQF